MQSTGQTSTHERSLMSMQGSEMMYVIAGLTLPASVEPPISSSVRSNRADLTITWSKPAAWARRRPVVSVWFVKPSIGTSG